LSDILKIFVSSQWDLPLSKVDDFYRRWPIRYHRHCIHVYDRFSVDFVLILAQGLPGERLHLFLRAAIGEP
jgi:hypothetical protein